MDIVSQSKTGLNPLVLDIRKVIVVFVSSGEERKTKLTYYFYSTIDYDYNCILCGKIVL